MSPSKLKKHEAVSHAVDFSPSPIESSPSPTTSALPKEIKKQAATMLAKDLSAMSSDDDDDDADDDDYDVGELEHTAEPANSSYNEKYMGVMNDHVDIIDTSFKMCVFDDDRAKNGKNGGSSVRRMVNTKYIQIFSDLTSANRKISALRSHIYGDTVDGGDPGGSADDGLRSGTLDQESFSVHWQKIWSKTKFHIFWYTTKLSQAARYIPQQNLTEVENFDTEISLVAFPAVYRASEFGNDYYAVKKRFTNYKELLNALVPLTPPLESDKPKSKSFASSTDPRGPQDLKAPNNPNFFIDIEGNRVNVFNTTADVPKGHTYAARARDEDMARPRMISMNNRSRNQNSSTQAVLKADRADHMKTKQYRTTALASSQMDRDRQSHLDLAAARRYKQLTGNNYDPTDPESQEWMTDIKDGVKKAAGKVATAAKDKVQEMTAKQFEGLQADGWREPPPHGYGTHADDHPDAQDVIFANNEAHARNFEKLYGIPYDENDPASFSFVEDAKAAATKASEAIKSAATKAADVGGKVAKAGADAAGKVATAAKDTLTAKQFGDLKKHGWRRPPDYGYGNYPGDHPDARALVNQNDRAHVRHFEDIHGIPYDENDPASFGWMQDAKDGAVRMATAAAKKAGEVGSKVAKAGADAVKAGSDAAGKVAAPTTELAEQ